MAGSSVTTQRKREPETIDIKPKWLFSMIPAPWLTAAEQLSEIKAAYDVSVEDMEIYISIAQSSPYPLVDTVKNFATGEWIIETTDNPDGSKHFNVKQKSPIIIPKGSEVTRFGKQA